VSAAETVRLTAWLRGRVQGVGMRWWVRSRALELGLVGWARNLEDGRVEVVAEGTRTACADLLETFRSAGAPGRIDTVVERWSEARGLGETGDPGFLER
jgi:acylphosphatase